MSLESRLKAAGYWLRSAMRHVLIGCLLFSGLLLWGGGAFAQATQTAQTAETADTEKEAVAIAEVGGAGSWSLTGGGAGSYGPSAAVEFTPIEHWLEIEAGVTPLFARHSTEWDTDLLLKKPWTLSKKVEFMAGVGPEWVHLRNGGVVTNSVSLEVAGDFMFWPSKKRRFGWYLEPAYDYNFGGGHEQSIGISGGLLIPIP